MEDQLTTREIDPHVETAVFDEIIRLRWRGWAAQMPMPLTRDDLIDPFEQSARHWAIFDGETVAAAARLSIHDRLEDVPEAICLGGAFAEEPPTPIGFLSRLVVAPEYRGRGLSRALDAVRIRAAEDAHSASLLVLIFDVTGESRIAQLVASGFTVLGRGQRDDHPKFSHLAAPVVLQRLLGRRNTQSP